MVVPIPKMGYNKKSGKKWPSYDPFYYWKEAQECLVLCSGHVGGSIMAIQIPKTGYNKNISKQWPSYGPFL